MKETEKHKLEKNHLHISFTAYFSKQECNEQNAVIFRNNAFNGAPSLDKANLHKQLRAAKVKKRAYLALVT